MNTSFETVLSEVKKEDDTLATEAGVKLQHQNWISSIHKQKTLHAMSIPDKTQYQQCAKEFAYKAGEIIRDHLVRLSKEFVLTSERRIET